MLSLSVFRIATFALLFTTVAASGTAFYFYQQPGPVATNNVERIATLNSQVDSYKKQISDLNSQVSSLNSQVDSYKAEIATFNGQVVSLTAQISQLQSTNSGLSSQIIQLQSTVSQLRSQVSQLESQVAQLQSQVATLQSQLAQFQSPNMKADLKYGNNCPIFSNCTYTVDGAYANIGGQTATNEQVFFTFYSQPNYTGQVLCTTTYIIGNVPGESVHILSTVNCAGNSSTQAQSASYQFS